MLLTESRASQPAATRFYVLQCVTFHIGFHKGVYVQREGRTKFLSLISRQIFQAMGLHYRTFRWEEAPL